MRSLQSWLREYRLYRRDEQGRFVKQDDHLMDATRYLEMSGLARARVAPVVEEERPRELLVDVGGYSATWMS